MYLSEYITDRIGPVQVHVFNDWQSIGDKSGIYKIFKFKIPILIE